MDKESIHRFVAPLRASEGHAPQFNRDLGNSSEILTAASGQSIFLSLSPSPVGEKEKQKAHFFPTFQKNVGHVMTESEGILFWSKKEGAKTKEAIPWQDDGALWRALRRSPL